MTKLNWTRTKRERSVPPRASWKTRSVAQIEQDLKTISDAWEGTALDRQAWGVLKRELKVAKLEAERLASVARRKEAELRDSTDPRRNGAGWS